MASVKYIVEHTYPEGVLLPRDMIEFRDYYDKMPVVASLTLMDVKIGTVGGVTTKTVTYECTDAVLLAAHRDSITKSLLSDKIWQHIQKNKITRRDQVRDLVTNEIIEDWTSQY